MTSPIKNKLTPTEQTDPCARPRNRKNQIVGATPCGCPPVSDYEPTKLKNIVGADLCVCPPVSENTQKHRKSFAKILRKPQKLPLINQ